MTSKVHSSQTTSQLPRAREGWYRGVKLQVPATSPKTSLSRLQESVKHAVAKNADPIAETK